MAINKAESYVASEQAGKILNENGITPGKMVTPDCRAAHIELCGLVYECTRGCRLMQSAHLSIIRFDQAASLSSYLSARIAHPASHSREPHEH